MHIDNILNDSIFDSNKEMKYSYRLVRENFFGGQAYGIEVERQDFSNNKLIYVERNEIRKISNTKAKVATLSTVQSSTVMEKAMNLSRKGCVSENHLPIASA